VWSDCIPLRRITDLLLRYNPIDFCHGKNQRKKQNIRMISKEDNNVKCFNISFKMHP
jgi:hypothetical protein